MKAPCKYPGCQTLLPHNGYCEAHKASKPKRKKFVLSESDQFRSSYKWQRVRKIKLGMNPLCEDPYKDHERRQVTETAKQIHHIIGLAECANDERAYSLENLMSVCWRCHARLERDEQKRLKEL
jgi:5-methylcytosine-specific restriction endonuclease McrA